MMDDDARPLSPSGRDMLDESAELSNRVIAALRTSELTKDLTGKEIALGCMAAAVAIAKFEDERQGIKALRKDIFFGWTWILWTKIRAIVAN